MDVLQFLCFAFIVSLSLFCTGSYGSKRFCEEQEEIFDLCSDRMEYFYLAKYQDFETLCKEIAKYLTCVHETNMTCPEMPLFQDSVFIDAIEHTRRTMTSQCRGYSVDLDRNCSRPVIGHLMSSCIKIIDQVQLDSSQDDLCLTNTQYRDCLLHVADVCRSDDELIAHNWPLALASTEQAMQMTCSGMQNDIPEGGQWGPSHIPHSTLHQVCSEVNVASVIEVCTVHIQQVAQVTSVSEEGCRHQYMYLSCMEQLFRNCPRVERKYRPKIRPAEEAFDALCPNLRCPREVQQGEEDVASYCMKDIQDMNPGDAAYCRELGSVPDCILFVRELCPPHEDPFEIDGVLRMLQTMLEGNCGVSADESTIDVDERTINQRKREPGSATDGQEEANKLLHLMSQVANAG